MRKDFRKRDFKKRDFKKGNFKRYRREEFFVPGNGLAVKVPDSNSGTLEKALRYLKRQLKDDGTMLKLKEKRYFEKPSMKRRIQKEEAIRNQQYQERIKKGYDRWHPCWTAIINGQAQ
jgi:small subunit ribosomal protein S21